jgi:hypothetical protein
MKLASEQAKWKYNHDPVYREQIKAANKRWREKNRSYWLEYYKLHPDIVSKAIKKWRNKYGNQNYMQEYYFKNKQRLLEYKKMRRLQAKNKVRIFIKDDSEIIINKDNMFQ